MNRRDFLSASAAASLALTAAGQQPKEGPVKAASAKLNGRLKQSVCRWCYGSTPLEELASKAKELGLVSVELLNPDEWDTVKKHGLTCAVASFVKSNPIPKGFNRVENHDQIIKELEERLPLVKAAGIPNQIVFSGNRGGLDDKEGLKNCVKGLKRIAPVAEKLGVVLVMELLNSKRDHKDRTPWGAELVKQVGSPNFKLLYDIYHRQIMEGDVIDTVLENYDAIAHFHTAGVPGRRDLDDAQELKYKAICDALVKKGYTGYLGQEFIPKNGFDSLKDAIAICDV